MVQTLVNGQETTSPPRRAAEIARHLCGLAILWLSILPPSFEFGWLLPGSVVPSFAIAFVTTTFLLLLRPRIGTIREARGISAALTIFLTTAVWSGILLGRGDVSVLTSAADAIRGFVARCAGMATGPLGEAAAALSMRPFALLLIGLVLFSFLIRSYTGFLLSGILFFLWGSLPPTSGMVAGALLWIAGFWMIAREALYLAPEEERHARHSPWLRRILLECREAPLDPKRLRLLLGTGRRARADLSFAIDSGLLTYDPAAGRLLAGDRLLASVAPGFIHSMTRIVDGMVRVSLIAAALGYFILPVDLLPESVLGPIGYCDDLFFFVSALVPTLAPLLRPVADNSSATRSPGALAPAEIIREVFPPQKTL